MLVNQEVAHFTSGKDSKTDIVERDQLLPVGTRVGGVDVPRREDTSHEPVEGRVTEDVEGRHGVGRELVQKHGLELALDEVQLEEGEDDPLDLGDGGLDLVLVQIRAELVDVGADRDHEGVDQDGSEVLHHEDGAPCHLGACWSVSRGRILRRRSNQGRLTEILHQELALRQNGGLVLKQSLAVLEDLLRGRIEESDTVKVSQAGLASNGNLGIFNGGSGGKIERCR